MTYFVQETRAEVFIPLNGKARDLPTSPQDLPSRPVTQPGFDRDTSPQDDLRISV